MDAIVIEVPDMNDSVSRITLLGTQYQIRFTYNDTVGQSHPNRSKDCPSIPSQSVLGNESNAPRRVRSPYRA